MRSHLQTRLVMLSAFYSSTQGRMGGRDKGYLDGLDSRSSSLSSCTTWMTYGEVLSITDKGMKPRDASAVGQTKNGRPRKALVNKAKQSVNWSAHRQPQASLTRMIMIKYKLLSHEHEPCSINHHSLLRVASKYQLCQLQSLSATCAETRRSTPHLNYLEV